MFFSLCSSVKELYQKIAECYDFSVDEVSAHLPFCFLQIYRFVFFCSINNFEPFLHVPPLPPLPPLVLLRESSNFAFVSSVPLNFFYCMCESWMRCNGESWRHYSSLLINTCRHKYAWNWRRRKKTNKQIIPAKYKWFIQVDLFSQSTMVCVCVTHFRQRVSSRFLINLFDMERKLRWVVGTFRVK